MPDLAMSVTVSRDLLGLDDLEINDHLAYAIGAQLLGGTVTWNRTQVTSPFQDGAVTTMRQRQVITETIVVEVYGDGPVDLHTKCSELVTAFTQDNFVLTVQVGSTFYVYQCEAADYGLSWVGSRFVSNQMQVTLSVPRQPQSLNAGQYV